MTDTVTQLAPQFLEDEEEGTKKNMRKDQSLQYKTLQ